MKKLNLFYEKFPHWIDTKTLFIKLFGKTNDTFWLDSSRVEGGLSRFSYMGKAKKTYTFSSQRNTRNVFSFLERHLKGQEIVSALPFDFVGGFIGYFGYELRMLTGSYVNMSFRSPYPDSMWFLVDQFLVFDHKEKCIYLVCLAEEEIHATLWFKKIKEQMCSQSIQKRINHVKKKRTITFVLKRNHKQYLSDIAACKRYLREGQSYQICLTNSFHTKASIDPLLLYVLLRKENPAPFAAFLKHDSLAILSSSPERFLHIDPKGNIEAKPIKGTSKRGIGEEQDHALAAKLLTSQKNRAENLMITDLLRNDLGKVSDIGSVTVPKLIALESYQTVHQLVSTIHAKLAKNKSVVDCIKACFPGGSMTGAPKGRTMEIIESLEKDTRGIYSGALGFLSFSKAIDLNIIIRTIVQKKDTLSIGAGGAILIQSDPEKEYEEMLLKADVLIHTITKALGAKKYIIKGQ